MKRKPPGMSKPVIFYLRMQLKVHSFPQLAQNVYFDDVLFQLAQKHEAGESLRFWESTQYGIVLGRIGKIEEDVDEAATRRDQIPIIYRASGGGTVVQGPGCLNYALVLSKQKHPVLNDLRASYQWISEKVIKSLQYQGIASKFCPISDLALSHNDMKFSGNAQRRSKDYVLHHGTILYQFDLDMISKYLKLPKSMPEYRNARDHKNFVTNIYINVPQFQAELAKEFGVSSLSQPLSPQEILALQNYNI